MSSTLTTNRHAHRPHRHAKRAKSISQHTRAHPRSAGAHHASRSHTRRLHIHATALSTPHGSHMCSTVTTRHTTHKSMQPEPHITRHNVTHTCVMCAHADHDVCTHEPCHPEDTHANVTAPVASTPTLHTVRNTAATPTHNAALTLHEADTQSHTHTQSQTLIEAVCLVSKTFLL